jgi:hypothetical protein
MAFGDNFKRWLDSTKLGDNWITSDEEQAQADLAEQSHNIAQGFYETARPSTDALMGLTEEMFSPEALGMPPRPGSGRGGATNREQLSAWEREYATRLAQAHADPYFGLELLGDPETGQTAADPESIAAQRRALQGMGDIYDQGGYTAAERAQNQLSMRDAAMGERSQRLAVQQQAASRGMGGGGMELMGALAAQQGGANRASDAAAQFAIAGQQRAMQALQNYGQQAEQMRHQSFGEDETRRSAQDAWTQANVGMQNDWTRARGDAAQTGFQNNALAVNVATGGNDALAAFNKSVEDEASANWDATKQTAQQIAAGVATGGASYAAGAGR